jgi:hypothetical protein
MVAVTMSIGIECPVADVFTVLTRVDLASRWSRAISEELITPGPMRIGSRRRAVIPAFAGRTSENVMELTELEPDRHLAMRGVSGFPVPVRISIDLEPAGHGTHLTWVTYLEPAGPLRLAGPLLGRIYRMLFSRDLRRLKSMMEDGTLWQRP